MNDSVFEHSIHDVSYLIFTQLSKTLNKQFILTFPTRPTTHDFVFILMLLHGAFSSLFVVHIKYMHQVTQPKLTLTNQIKGILWPIFVQSKEDINPSMVLLFQKMCFSLLLFMESKKFLLLIFILLLFFLGGRIQLLF